MSLHYLESNQPNGSEVGIQADQLQNSVTKFFIPNLVKVLYLLLN